MTAETNSFELAKSVLATSMVMVIPDDWGGSDVKTASQTGGDESEDVHSMVFDVAPPDDDEYFPGAQASQLASPSPI